jgi:glycosyltransferase involved in cell wall biosynthesis
MRKIKTSWFIIRFFFWFLVTKALTLYFRCIPKKKTTKDLIYLESLTSDGAGYNYRAKKWMELFQKEGWSVESRFIVPFADDFFRMTNKQNLHDFIIYSIRKQIVNIIYARNFKLVIVRRNLLIYNQYGNLFMEKFLVSAIQTKLLDFDDDLGCTSNNSDKTLFNYLLGYERKHFYKSLKFYDGIITGSNYLKNLALLHRNEISQKRIAVIPTCVDYEKYCAKSYEGILERPLTFGWIGGNYNLFLLEKIIPSLNEIYKSYKFNLLVIAGVDHYEFKANFPVSYEKYSIETEVSSLLKIDIGLMPLINDKVSMGKCGFKLIQYMGLGIPSIGSAITVNEEIIDHSINGWLVYDEDDWTSTLKSAIESKSKLQLIGLNSRIKIEKKFSFSANFQEYKNFLEYFKMES